MSTRPSRFTVTRPSSLKKTTPRPRPVDSEATKPKLKKVEPPTYEQQNDEQGEADESSSEGEEVDEAMNAPPADGKSNLAPASKQTKTVSAQDGTYRPKVTKRPKQDGVPANPLTDGASLAPHMKMLSLTSSNKSVMAKVNGMSFYIPFLWMFGYVSQAVGSLLVGKKQVMDAHPLYNSVFTRTAIFYLAHIQILRVREFANVITDDELKVLKRFRSAYDFNKIVIPGPYVLLFQSLGMNIPANKRFLPTVPAFPSLDKLLHGQGTGTVVAPAKSNMVSALGFLPWLIGMSSLVATKESITEERKMKKTDDSDDVKTYLNFAGKYFVPFHRDRKNPNNWFGTKMETAPSADSNTGFFAQSAMFNMPFPDTKTSLKTVYEAVPPVRFPPYTTGKKMTRLIEYFYLDKDVSFLGVLFEALAIEARFFEGMTTFENIDVETGNAVNCVRTLTLDTDNEENTAWFARFRSAEDGIETHSRVSDISDTDLQLATFSGIITKIINPGTLAHPLNLHDFDSVHTDGEDIKVVTSGTIYSEGVVKRKIPRQNEFIDEIRTHIYTSMAYDLSTVV